MTTRNLTYQYKTANIIVKIIVINVAVFLLVNLIAFFMQMGPGTLTKWFVLPDELGSLVLQPWSLFTYSFLHFGFWHILFNMLWLHWFGKFILNLFSEKRFLTIYLLGALFGGLAYLLAYNIFPVFSNSKGFLIGASGAVMAVMVFIATYTPNTAVRIFNFTIKIWQIAVFLLVFDLVRLPTSGNAGGLLAHIGGALFGYIYALQLSNGKDIGKWFEKILDWFQGVFKHKEKKPLKTVHRNTPKRKTSSKVNTNSKSENQKKVDAILDKIGKSGYESLTKAEKDYLFKAGKED